MNERLDAMLADLRLATWMTAATLAFQVAIFVKLFLR
jgi:hypothetical protein